MTFLTETSAPTGFCASCDVPAYLDLVDHRPECAYLREMEAKIKGDILAPSEVADPEVAVVRRYGSNDLGRVFIPGIWD